MSGRKRRMRAKSNGFSAHCFQGFRPAGRTNLSSVFSYCTFRKISLLTVVEHHRAANTRVCTSSEPRYEMQRVNDMSSCCRKKRAGKLLSAFNA